MPACAPADSAPPRGSCRALRSRALAGCAFPAQATVLYKSIGPNGVIQFSDRPPEDGVVVEERLVPDASSDGQPIGVAPDGMPLLAFENPLQIGADDGLDRDEALATANRQVDLAEHALALARASTWTRREGLRLRNSRRASTDTARIAFYERNLRTARANLLAAMDRSMANQTGVRPPFPLTETPDMRLAHR